MRVINDYIYGYDDLRKWPTFCRELWRQKVQGVFAQMLVEVLDNIVVGASMNSRGSGLRGLRRPGQWTQDLADIADTLQEAV